MLTPLESRVVDLMVPFMEPDDDLLRTQLQSADIDHRTKDETGFFTYFTITDENIPRTLPDLVLKGVEARHPKLKNPAKFFLHIKSGVVAILEGCTHDDEPWPADEENFSVE